MKIALRGKTGKGHFLLVDKADFNIAKYFYWGENAKGYVFAHIPKSGRSNLTGKSIYAHHLIWQYHFGSPPKGMEIDHINRNKLDCRIKNLRLATHQQNAFNMMRKNKYKGVYWNTPNKKWVARIMLNYKGIHLGCFKTKKEAALAYNRKAKELFGEFAKLNYPY